MSKTYRYANETALGVNNTLRRCKGGAHQAKHGKHMDRSKVRVQIGCELRENVYHIGM